MRSNLSTDPKKIAIFRALNLGDLLCAIPAVRALRARYPNANITLIGLPSMADLAQRFSKYFDSFASFPGVPGLPEQSFDPEAFVQFLQRERQEHYDLVLQMHGKGAITNSLVCMLGARRYAGYFDPGAFCPDATKFMPYPEGIPEVRRHLKLMQFLGIAPKGEAIEFPITPDECAQLDVLSARHGFGRQQYVCIHPGARDVRRWWAPDKFAQVADVLASRGNTVVFTGTADEHDGVQRVQEKMSRSSINLAGETDLGVLAALIGRARLLVSNDTGVSHLAAAMGTPSVVIFLTSDPARWAPLDRERHRIVHSDEPDDVGDVLFHVDRVLKAPFPDAMGYQNAQGPGVA
ncbi:MAG TPA: glycosyltransferase family 9 protein [Gammaproteobacteria bacterium]